jgi:hypothetical protein
VLLSLINCPLDTCHFLVFSPRLALPGFGEYGHWGRLILRLCVNIDIREPRWPFQMSRQAWGPSTAAFCVNSDFLTGSRLATESRLLTNHVNPFIGNKTSVLLNYIRGGFTCSGHPVTDLTRKQTCPFSSTISTLRTIRRTRSSCKYHASRCVETPLPVYFASRR